MRQDRMRHRAPSQRTVGRRQCQVADELLLLLHQLHQPVVHTSMRLLTRLENCAADRERGGRLRSDTRHGWRHPTGRDSGASFAVKSWGPQQRATPRQTRPGRAVSFSAMHLTNQRPRPPESARFTEPPRRYRLGREAVEAHLGSPRKLADVTAT